MAGIAAGLYIFTTLDARTLANGLGVVVFLCAAYALWPTFRAEAGWAMPERLLRVVAGTVSGAVGTTFGTMATPFFVMYLEARKLAKHAFRATMSATLLACSVPLLLK